MKKQRPTDAELIDLLQQPHFRRRQDEPMPSTDPIAPTPMVLEIDRIKPYDRNPRRVPNSEYERIKESIRASGMDQTLTITRRPGEDLYMVAAGGNTRLQAIKELWQETGEERFGRVHCLYRPWTGDTDALVAHLKENDLRGDLTFIDRALAVRELRQLIEEGTDDKLSSRRLSESLKERGYSVSYKIIQWFDYAVDALHPAIPTALRAGMGRPQIERIRDLDRAFGKAWESLGLGDPASAQPVFADVLSRHDGETLDLDPVRRDLEAELSVSADCDVQRASLLLGAALDGRAITAAPPGSDASAPEGTSVQDPSEDWAAPAAHTEKNPSSPASGEPQRRPASPSPRQAQASERGATTTHAEASVAPPNPSPPSRESDPGDAPPPDRPVPSPALPSDLKSLRARCWTLATRLAVKARMGQDVVIRIPTGVGYLIAPVPPDALVQQAPPELVRTAAVVWWHLAALSEQFAAGSRAIDRMPAEWSQRPIGEALRATTEEPRKTLLQWQIKHYGPEYFNEVPPLNGPDIGPLMYRIWSDRDWSDWMALVDTYRAIHRLTDGNPWRDA